MKRSKQLIGMIKKSASQGLIIKSIVCNVIMLNCLHLTNNNKTKTNSLMVFQGLKAVLYLQLTTKSCKVAQIDNIILGSKIKIKSH